jgi:hypothetical protein
MTKVWLVIERYVARYENDYDSNYVDKIFSTKEAAEAYLEGKPRKFELRVDQRYYTLEERTVHD